MSILVVKPIGKELSGSELMQIGLTNHYREIGIAVAKDGVLHRHTGFQKLTELCDFISSEQLNNYPYMVYANNPSDLFPVNQFSPVLVEDEWAYASCGNVLRLKECHKGRSNANVFLKQILEPNHKKAPGLFRTEYFCWMIKNMIPKYVGIAFLNKSGKFTVINHELFTVNNGVLHMDFDIVKDRIVNPYKVKTPPKLPPANPHANAQAIKYINNTKATAPAVEAPASTILSDIGNALFKKFVKGT